MKRLLPVLAGLVAAGLAGTGPACAGSLEIAGAWLNQPPPGQSGAAVYMELHNRGSAPLAVVGARVDSAASASIHGHSQVEGMMRMYPVPRLEIAAGDSVILQPGGYHLMVGGLHAAPQPGTVLRFCLRLDDGAEECADARVRTLEE